MIKLETKLIWPGCAQGKYIVKAKGFILAILSWGREEKPLADWGPFAYVPVDPAGNGMFCFQGQRGIPREATHVWARCYTADFAGFEDVSVKIPEKFVTDIAKATKVQQFSVMTDLHLASKPWKIKQALSVAESDTILLLGDLTNDGLKSQFEKFKACIEETVPGKKIFSVTGNHDVLHPSRACGTEEKQNYEMFQSYLLGKSKEAIAYAPDGRSYAVRLGDVDLIGLQCVTNGRKFLFEDGALEWLEEHLTDMKDFKHIVMCHAPLLAHNPNRNEGSPYLDKNKKLQEIVNRHGNIIFLSGHTHVSPNILDGNCEYDEDKQNIYLDCGSVVATDTAGEQGMMHFDWKDGCKTELIITENEVGICMSSIDSGVKFPRGYYRVVMGEKISRNTI